MQVYNYKYGEPLPKVKSVLALGFFDGVHLAHRRLLDLARDIATREELAFGVFTFSSDGNVKRGVSRIYTDKEKISLLEELGADFTVLAHFPSISGLSPEEFVSEVLVREAGAKIAVAGFNFRFGKGASGDCNDLARLLSIHGAQAFIADEIMLGERTVSSSLIRRLLTDGDIEEANRLLVRPYSLSGVVSHGDGRGRILGFPTLNTPLAPERVIPRLGVYRSEVVIDGVAYRSLTNVGKCPTLGERAAHAETHLLDFSGTLYGEKINVSLFKFLRDEMVFEDAEDLKAQISRDIAAAFGEEK